MSYQNSDVAQQLSAQLIFGARGANGKLPVSLGEDFPVNTHYETKPLRRLQYGTPESVGVNSYKLKKIDSLAKGGLWGDMYPGAQILVARKGKVIYNKTFGHHTQQKKNTVKPDDIYDVASLTKILATLPMVMELVDRGVLSLDTKLSEMLPEYKNSNKANITLQEILTHTARLKAWIPFYVHTLDSVSKQPSKEYYKKNPNEEFNIKVAEGLYMRRDYKDSIFEIIRTSDLRDRKGYKYSDLPYYMLKKYLEGFYGKGLDELVQSNLYESLGANHTTYSPLSKFSKADIVPTEEDSYFRMQEVHGYVHDQGAAMIGLSLIHI